MADLVERLYDAAELRTDERTRENLCMEAAGVISALRSKMEAAAKSILRFQELCASGELSAKGAIDAAAEDARALVAALS